ncbi:MAG: DEAD/DEAH box helicase [Phycisphaerae bacterium]|nr:DEAD/DEAH box helicase [Phycisphaerae bacterium]
MPFTTFGLTDPLVRGILATGYTAPTDIQSQAIPAALAGSDIIGCAQTGTGKTAAFVLPILDRLSHEPNAGRKRVVRSLILTPTRELAVQIEKSILGYGRFTELKALAVYGGVSIPGQIKGLTGGVDIVVATPGRLIDHLQRKTIDLSKVEVLVLDEADRMLDMGFVKDVRRIVSGLPKKRQTLLFSATMSPEVNRLAADMLKTPKVIQIGRPRNPIETITQHFYTVEKSLKMDLLVHMIEDWRMFSVLVFSRTKHGADKISRRLKTAGVIAVSIHSGRTQNQRQRALDGFRSGKFQVLVATDIAARGINVEGISHVINYDVPTHAEDYVHRIGRTGRATATGDAITFVSKDEEKYLREIGKYIERRLSAQPCKGFSYVKSTPDEPKPAKSTGPAQGERSGKGMRPAKSSRPHHGKRPVEGTRGDQSNRPPRSKTASGAKKPYRGQRRRSAS